MTENVRRRCFRLRRFGFARSFWGGALLLDTTDFWGIGDDTLGRLRWGVSAKSDEDDEWALSSAGRSIVVRTAVLVAGDAKPSTTTREAKLYSCCEE